MVVCVRVLSGYSENSAYYPPRPSASLSSANNWFLKYDLLCYEDETGDSTEYTLSELLGCSQMNDHQETYIAISEWLQKKVRVPPSTILKNQAINEIKHNPALWTSTCKRPDLHIVTTDMEHVLVQVEVESGRNKKSTIMKLTLGVMDQLCRLRNHVHTGIMKCSGFYFMRHGSKGDHVIHVELEWDDDSWKFIQTRRRLSKDSVATEIKNALDAAKLSLGSTPLQQTMLFPSQGASLSVALGNMPNKFNLGSRLSLLMTFLNVSTSVASILWRRQGYWYYCLRSANPSIVRSLCR